MTEQCRSILLTTKGDRIWLTNAGNVYYLRALEKNVARKYPLALVILLLLAVSKVRQVFSVEKNVEAVDFFRVLDRSVEQEDLLVLLSQPRLPVTRQFLVNNIPGLTEGKLHDTLYVLFYMI